MMMKRVTCAKTKEQRKGQNREEGAEIELRRIIRRIPVVKRRLGGGVV
jgi:hypothetical protein